MGKQTKSEQDNFADVNLTSESTTLARYALTLKHEDLILSLWHEIPQRWLAKGLS